MSEVAIEWTACDVCGKPVMPNPSQKSARTRGGKVLCSEPCRKKAKADNLKKRRKDADLPEVPCHRCKQLFKPSLDQYYRRRSKSRRLTCPVCLERVRAEGAKRRVPCAFCGKTFHPAPGTRKQHERGDPVYCHHTHKKAALQGMKPEDVPDIKPVRSIETNKQNSFRVVKVRPFIPWSGSTQTDFPALYDPFG